MSDIKKLQIGMMPGERASILFGDTQCDIVFVRHAVGDEIKIGFDAPSNVKILRHNCPKNKLKQLGDDDWKEE